MIKDPSSPSSGGRNTKDKETLDAWLICPTCSKNLSFPSTSSYYTHISSKMHTWKALKIEKETEPSLLGNVCVRLPSFLLWNQEINERSIVVTNLQSVSSPKGLLNHFINYGFVMEFIADPNGNFAVIQYWHRSCIRKVIEDPRANRVDGGCIRIRMKASISTLEWIILLDLDGNYEKSDQPFFISHCEVMVSLNPFPLPQQLLTFMSEVSLSPQGIKKQQFIFDELYVLLLPLFPKMNLYMLQPQVPDLSEADPVFEMFMDPFGECKSNGKGGGNKSYYNHHSHKYQVAIGRVQYILSRFSKGVSILSLAVEASTVPEDKLRPQDTKKPLDALLFTHFESGIKCKISFDDGMAPFVGSLVELLMQIDPILHPVLKFIQYWARVMRFSGTHPGFNMMLAMMVAVYFMKKNILPSVEALQKLYEFTDKEENHTYVQGWKTSFCTHLPTIQDYLKRRGKHKRDWEGNGETYEAGNKNEKISSSNSNHASRVVFNHLRDFFGSFSWLDFRTVIISPLLGEIMSRTEFVSKYAKAGGTSCSGSLTKLNEACMVVQHPFDLCRNMVVNIDESSINRMQIQFRNTYRRIVLTMDGTSPKMSEMFPDFNVLLKWEPKLTLAASEGGQSFVSEASTNTNAAKNKDKEKNKEKQKGSKDNDDKKTLLPKSDKPEPSKLKTTKDKPKQDTESLSKNLKKKPKEKATNKKSSDSRKNVGSSSSNSTRGSSISSSRKGEVTTTKNKGTNEITRHNSITVIPIRTGSSGSGDAGGLGGGLIQAKSSSSNRRCHNGNRSR